MESPSNVVVNSPGGNTPGLFTFTLNSQSGTNVAIELIGRNGQTLAVMSKVLAPAADYHIGEDLMAAWVAGTGPFASLGKLGGTTRDFHPLPDFIVGAIVKNFGASELRITAGKCRQTGTQQFPNPDSQPDETYPVYTHPGFALANWDATTILTLSDATGVTSLAVGGITSIGWVVQ